MKSKNKNEQANAVFSDNFPIFDFERRHHG